MHNVRIKLNDNHHWRLDNKTLERLQVFENKEEKEKKGGRGVNTRKDISLKTSQRPPRPSEYIPLQTQVKPENTEETDCGIY